MLQKSQEGLLRILLRTILKNAQDIIRRVFPDENQFAIDAIRSGQPYIPRWTDTLLRHALRRTIDLLPGDLRLCLFIDSLDGYEADTASAMKVPELLASITSSQVKMVVSSRPEPIYCDAFDDHPQLWMEILTHDDITAYVEDHIGKYIHKSQATSDGLVQRLVQEIVLRASRVFLWVVLVVNFLVQSLVNHDQHTKAPQQA